MASFAKTCSCAGHILSQDIAVHPFALPRLSVQYSFLVIWSKFTNSSLQIEYMCFESFHVGSKPGHISDGEMLERDQTNWYWNRYFFFFSGYSIFLILDIFQNHNIREQITQQQDVKG